jgi:hypothetical protein
MRGRSTTVEQQTPLFTGTPGQDQPAPNGEDMTPAAVSTEEPVKSPFETIENEKFNGPSSIFRDLDALKIEPDEEDEDFGEDVLTSIAIRRPGKRACRAYWDDRYHFEAYILEDVDDKVVYYIAPAVGKALAEQPIENFKHVILVLCIGKSGRMFFWPIPAKGTFRGSGLKAVDTARKDWIKAVGSLEAGGYQVTKMSLEDYGEPKWPDNMPSKEELLVLAFHDNIITTAGHSAIRNAKNV